MEIAVEQAAFAENAVRYQVELEQVGGEFKDLNDLLTQLNSKLPLWSRYPPSVRTTRRLLRAPRAMTLSGAAMNIKPVVLLDLLERAAGGESQFTSDELVFCTVCEFWSAVATHSLASYLRQEAAPRLTAARLAFSRIGANQVSSVLAQALHLVLISATRPAADRRWIRALTQQLLSATDPVNRLIADFASTMAAEVDHHAHRRLNK